MRLRMRMARCVNVGSTLCTHANVSPITLLSQIFQVPLSLLLRKMIVLLIL